MSDKSTPEHIEAFKQLAKEHDIRITSAFGHADLRTAEGLTILKKHADIAAELGVRFFTVSAPERSTVVYDNLVELADYTLYRGMIVALETHPPLVPDAAGGMQTIRELKHSNIRINFDTANPYYYNESIDVVAELEKLAEYVVHMHLKESRKKFHDWYFPALGEGEGCIDFAGILRVMEAVGFRGPYSFELEGIKGEEESLELRHSRVVRSLEYLRNIGVEY
jgi:sugar phosphate isomerase/epimerase